MYDFESVQGDAEDQRSKSPSPVKAISCDNLFAAGYNERGKRTASASDIPGQRALKTQKRKIFTKKNFIPIPKKYYSTLDEISELVPFEFSKRKRKGAQKKKSQVAGSPETGEPGNKMCDSSTGSTEESSDSREKPKRKIFEFRNVFIFMFSCIVVILLMVWKPHEYAPSIHTMFLHNYDSMIYGQLCTVPCSVELDNHLPIEVVAIKMISQDMRKASECKETSLTIGWNTISLTDGEEWTSELLGSVVLSSGKETEFVGEYDIANTLAWGNSSQVEFYIVEDSSCTSVALIVEVQQMSSLARHKIFLSVFLVAAVYILIALECIDRVLIALIGSFVALLVVTVVQSPPDMGLVIKWMDERTLSLLFGMMVIVTVLEDTGVFEWFAVRLVQLSSREIQGSLSECDPFKLMVSMCIITGAFSAFIDNVTTVLLISPVSVCLSNILVRENLYKELAPDAKAATEMEETEAAIDNGGKTTEAETLKPQNVTTKVNHKKHSVKKVEKLAIPLLMVNGIFANMGGCMSLIGAVPNVIIASRFPDHVNFENFMLTLTPVILATTPVVVIILRRQFQEALACTYRIQMDVLYERYKIKENLLLLRGGTVTCFVIFTFFLHPVHQRPSGWLALIGGMATAAVGASKKIAEVLQDVQWDTLLFIAGLYVLGAALIQLGLVRDMGDMIIEIVKSYDSQSRLTAASIVILWTSATVSGLMSNIGFAATMTRVITIFGEDPDLNLPVDPLIWSLCLGISLGGNLTLIASAANIIAAGVAEHNGMHISFMDFVVIGGQVWLITNFIAMVWLLIMYGWY